MFRLAAELGVPVVATNDAHYHRKDDAEAHDVLLAIGMGKDLDDPNRFRFFGRESYVKSEQEMGALFPDRPDVIAETARLAALCEFDFEKRYFLPQYPRPAEFASDTDLLFERFLNPERVTMPDIDLDFCFERRGEVIEYVRSRYGRESVGQIITFGTLKARAAFRDVARTLRLEVGDVDRLTKTIPSGPAYSLSLAEAAQKVPELRAAAEQDEPVRHVLDPGSRIEGPA